MESNNKSKEGLLVRSFNKTTKAIEVFVGATKESLKDSRRKFGKAIPMLIASISIASLMAIGGSPVQAEDQIGGAVSTPAGGWIPTATATKRPTNTPLPTATRVPPTATIRPTFTLVPPTFTPEPTRTPVPPTFTPRPTSTPVPPTFTPEPTDTPKPTKIATIIATQTLIPTSTTPAPEVTRVPTATKKKPTSTPKPKATATKRKPTATPEKRPTPKIIKTLINSKILVLPRTGEDLSFFEQQRLLSPAVRFITDARFSKDNWDPEELAEFRDTYDSMARDIVETDQYGTMCTNDAVVGKQADLGETGETLPVENSTQAEKPLVDTLSLTIASGSLFLLSVGLLRKEALRRKSKKTN